ncbi:uncharacterized protein METZ01_LOCUS471459, partial [marine metagenome]
TNANDGVINMGTLRVDGSIALTTHGDGNATAVDSGRFDFAASTVGGDLTATSTGGRILQSGALDIEGTSAFTTDANNKVITLTNASNAFTGALTITTNDGSNRSNASIDGGTTALIIAASTIDGDLTLTSGAAAGITDSGNVTVGGNLTATTDLNSGVIDMDTLRVDGTMALTTHSGGAATVVNDVGLIFAASTVRGALSATATTGNITQGSGNLAITGAATFITVAGGSNIILDGSGNAFAAAVT